VSTTFTLRPALSLVLSFFIIAGNTPVSAAEITPPAAAALGEMIGLGNVWVDGKPVDSGPLLNGSHIRTGELSNAKVALLNGNTLTLSGKTELNLNQSDGIIQVDLTSGGLAFAASDTHVAFSIHEYELRPDEGASGSIAFTDHRVVTVRMESGNATIRDTDGNVDSVLSGKSERVLSIRGTSTDEPIAQIASNLPAAGPEPQEQTGAGQTNPPTTAPAQQPPAKNSGSHSKTLPIILAAAGGGAVAAALLLSRDDKCTPPDPACPAPPTETTTLGFESSSPPISSTFISPGTTVIADTFSLQTSAGTDSITAITVILGSGNASGLSLVEITDDQAAILGGRVYGSISNPLTDTPTISLSTSITATTTISRLNVRITAKSHGSMPAPPGSIYGINAFVNNWTGSNKHAGSDRSDVNVIVDNQSPGDVTEIKWTSISTTQVQLRWTNPADTDLSQIVVLRSTSPVVDTPAEGVSYSINAVIGAAQVACLTSSTAPFCSLSAQGYYKIFLKDSRNNYSIGVAAVPPEETIVTTLGTVEGSTPPTPVLLAPGGPATVADAFSFQTTTGFDRIQSVTVSLGSGAFSGSIAITNSSGTTLFGSSGVTSDSVTIALRENIEVTGIPVSSTPTTYLVRVTPRSHATMPPPPGATYLVQATVTDWAGGVNPHDGADTTYIPILIDNQSPNNVTSATATIATPTQVDLSWSNPTDSDLAKIIALRSTSPITVVPAEGIAYSIGNTIGASTVACVVTAPASSCSDTGLTAQTQYFYKLFALDSSGNYATGSDVGGVTPQSVSNGSSLVVSKSVDHSVVAPGDALSFSLAISNSGTQSITTTTLNDTLPPGFALTAGSTKIHILGSSGEELEVRAVSPTASGDSLVFPIGVLGPGGRATITYSAVVKSNAHPGEQASGVVGIANLFSGEHVKSNPAQVRVTVTSGAFSLNQVLIGRVFEDRNRNGRFDSGEPGIENVRVVTSSGRSATTDSDGQYSLASLAPGSVLVAIDPATRPPGYELPSNEDRLGGAGRMQVTPLDGGGLLRQNFGLIRTAANPATAAVAGARMEMTFDRPIMKAGGNDMQLIRIHAPDESVIVTTTSGALMDAGKVSDPFPCESVLSLNQIPDQTRRLELRTESGEAAVCLVSDSAPGTAHLRASSTEKPQLDATADVRYEAAQRAPLLVAIGEVGIGLSRPGKDATDGARRVDGETSIFFQDSPRKNDLFTMALRTKGGINSASGANGLFESDPMQRVYPVMGDASSRQELAQSSSRLYSRYDHGKSYVMYGDLRGDTAADGRSELLEYNRNVTGVRFQLQSDNGTNWLQGQAARPRTAYRHDITNALEGSIIRLSQSQIVRGSESISLEIRDRRNPEVIVSRETLVRNVDYSLDPLSGVLFLMRPISLFDASLNTVQLVSTYEYQAIGTGSDMFLGRGSYSLNSVGLRLGASALSQNEGGSKFAVGGVELEQKLWSGGHFKMEVPVSNGRYWVQNSLSDDNLHNGTAIRAEVDQPLGFRNSVLHGRLANTGEGFFNPYGTVTVSGQQFRGVSFDTRGIQSGKLSFAFQQEKNRNRSVDNQRQAVSATLTQPLAENLTLDAGIDRRNFEDLKAGREIHSELVSAGVKWKPLPRLETSLRREQNVGEADPTYPTQTLLGAQYTLSSGNRIFATQRLSDAPIIPISGAETSGVLSPQSRKETAIGVESRWRQNTSLTTNYKLDASGTGTDSFAVMGIVTRLPIRSGLSVDWTLDNAIHLAGTGKGYVGGSFGFTELKEDKLLLSTRYEIRRRDRSQKIFTAGIVGQLTPSTSAVARFRNSDYGTGNIGRINDGQLAISLRPKLSDRLALLFSYNFGNANIITPGARDFVNANSETNSTIAAATGRTDRLSADGLVEIKHGFEFYSRVAAARTPGMYGGSRLGTYLQGRLQKSLFYRFDIAGEARWVRESMRTRGALVTGIEFGTWLTRDLRIGLGYSPSGFANPGALLNSTAARGGLYLAISSKLSSIFDLMGTPQKSR